MKMEQFKLCLIIALKDEQCQEHRGERDRVMKGCHVPSWSSSARRRALPISKKLVDFKALVTCTNSSAINIWLAYISITMKFYEIQALSGDWKTAHWDVHRKNKPHRYLRKKKKKKTKNNKLKSKSKSKLKAEKSEARIREANVCAKERWATDWRAEPKRIYHTERACAQSSTFDVWYNKLWDYIILYKGEEEK